jgi:hypothetical protein
MFRVPGGKPAGGTPALLNRRVLRHLANDSAAINFRFDDVVRSPPPRIGPRFHRWPDAT